MPVRSQNRSQRNVTVHLTWRRTTVSETIPDPKWTVPKLRLNDSANSMSRARFSLAVGERFRLQVGIGIAYSENWIRAEIKCGTGQYRYGCMVEPEFNKCEDVIACQVGVRVSASAYYPTTTISGLKYLLHYCFGTTSTNLHLKTIFWMVILLNEFLRFTYSGLGLWTREKSFVADLLCPTRG